MNEEITTVQYKVITLICSEFPYNGVNEVFVMRVFINLHQISSRATSAKVTYCGLDITDFCNTSLFFIPPIYAHLFTEKQTH